MTGIVSRCVSSHRSRGRWLLAAALASCLAGCNTHRLVYEALSEHYNDGSADPLEQRRHYEQQVENWQAAHDAGQLDRSSSLP